MQMASAAQQRTGAHLAHNTFLPPKFCLANPTAHRGVGAAIQRGDPLSGERVVTTAVSLSKAAPKNCLKEPVLPVLLPVEVSQPLSWFQRCIKKSPITNVYSC